MATEEQVAEVAEQLREGRSGWYKVFGPLAVACVLILGGYVGVSQVRSNNASAERAAQTETIGENTEQVRILVEEIQRQQEELKVLEERNEQLNLSLACYADVTGTFMLNITDIILFDVQGQELPPQAEELVARLSETRQKILNLESECLS